MKMNLQQTRKKRQILNKSCQKEWIIKRRNKEINQIEVRGFLWTDVDCFIANAQKARKARNKKNKRKNKKKYHN